MYNEFRFFLNFLQLPQFGRIEITEPVKFDGASFTVEQDAQRFGRDISFGSEEVSLEFYDASGFWDRLDTPQELPNGEQIEYMTMGLPFILHGRKLYGFDLEVEFIVQKNGVDFTVGVLDVKTSETDGLTVFKSKVVQETRRAQIKRDEETKIDIFSDKDLNGEPIEPAQPIQMLLKAKPEKQLSNWKQKQSMVQFAGGSLFVNHTALIGTDGIKDSLVPFTTQSGIGGNLTFAVDNFKYIRAREDLSNIKVKLNCDIDFVYRVTNPDGDSFARISLFVFVHDEPFEVSETDTYESYTLYDHLIQSTSNEDFHLPEVIEFELPFIGRGRCFSIFWSLSWDITTIGMPTDVGDFLETLGYAFSLAALGVGAPPGILFDVEGENYSSEGPTKWVFNSCDMEITATSTAIDSVISGVRYIDTFDQMAKSINGMSIEAPEFRLGGKYYDQILFSGNLIRQRTNVPFILDWKVQTEDLMEVAADYQVNPDRILLYTYPNYYNNVDMGAFTSPPDADFNLTFADKHTVRRFNYKYNTYEQAGDAGRTIDGVHTELQYLIPNNMQNNKEIVVKHIRDPFATEEARKNGVSAKPEQSLSIDDKTYLMDVVELPEGSMGGFTYKLLQRSTSVVGELEILNTSADGVQNEGSTSLFNWQLLGITLGQTFIIYTGTNAGIYTVTDIQPSVITLYNGALEIQDVDEFIQVEWEYTGVFWVNRTDEGFDVITGIESPDNFSNLRFTPRRNIENWEPLLHTWSMYRPDGTIRNTYFKNDPTLQTQFEGGALLVEKADIPVSELATPLVTPNYYSCKVIADFDMMIALWNAMLEQRGFIRIADTNGGMVKIFPVKFNYLWASEILSIEGEQKYESDVLTVDFIDGILRIYDAEYPEVLTGNQWYQITDGFVQLFDNYNRAITDLIYFENVRVNGVQYDTPEALAIALSLINND